MEFITQNGQVAIEIKPASFKEASRLKRAVAKGISGKDLGLSGDSLLDIKIDSIFQLLMDIGTSDEFEKSVMECLKCCIYDKGGKNLKITEQVFDDFPEAREDYYEIVSKCCEENLRPFFKSLVSEFKTRLAKAEKQDQEQE